MTSRKKMNRRQYLPRIMRQSSMALLAGVLLAAGFACGDRAESSLSAYIDGPRPASRTRIFDNAQLVPHKDQLASQLETLYRTADIDMVVVTFPRLDDQEINDVAARLMSNWKIGQNTNGAKGILFLLSVDEERVRFEIGYDLEWIYPDVFVGYVERDQMAPFFAAGLVQDGIAATLEMVISRANEKIEEQAYDPGMKKDPVSKAYYSGGAGASHDVRVKTVRIPDKTEYPDDIVSLFVPQPSPEEAFLLDMEKNKRHIRGYDFDLYTDETREISRDWLFTEAQMDNQVKDTGGKTFKVFTKKNLAIVVFGPEHRECAPFYLIKNDQGWQLDIATMHRTIHFNMRNQAHISNSRYIPLFEENGYTFDANGFLHYSGQVP